jgi:hypothetical protein
MKALNLDSIKVLSAAPAKGNIYINSTSGRLWVKSLYYWKSPVWAADSIQTCGTGTSNYGDTGGGTTAPYTMWDGTIYYQKVLVTNCGTVTSIHHYIGATAATTAKVALYTDNVGVPGTLVTNSASIQKSETINSYNTYLFTTPPTVAAATYYWIAFFSGQEHKGSNDGTETLYTQERAYASGFPASATGILVGSVYKFNAYITIAH